jgi:outer membrane phospholipase A
LSFKARVLASQDASAALWLAYTQQSYWQIGNAPLSRPFRETDYQPEAIVALSPDREWDGWRWRLLNLGFVHQSNGRGNPLSRSWNRVYAQFGVERENFAVLLRPWYRFRERYEDDDMPDIHRYYGSGDVVMMYRRDGHTIIFTGRLNPSTGLGAAQLEYSTPRWKWLGSLRLYVHAFSGYGRASSTTTCARTRSVSGSRWTSSRIKLAWPRDRGSRALRASPGRTRAPCRTPGSRRGRSTLPCLRAPSGAPSSSRSFPRA